MKTIQVTDDLYEKLKDFVVDPFDDTPELIITRAVDIAIKARRKWSPLDKNAPSSYATDDEDVEEVEGRPVVL
ncbi:MAG: hypothetical protein JW860_01790 [Sedimentisphaerales bacterium]|nr:hypothetical protein [Sedimentisphaerales bacterium]